MQRDDTATVVQEWGGGDQLFVERPRLYADFNLQPQRNVSRARSQPPKVAVLREQGSNGHLEMAAAFHAAGFEAVDVHTNDLLNDEADLRNFQALAVCGGFSYGDVLAAGKAWAARILHNNKLKDQFQHFFNRPDTLTLGVCNGCQLLAQIKNIIPGADHFPMFKTNASQQFESRLVMVQIKQKADSPFLLDMDQARLPIIVAHGEGRVGAEEAEYT